MSLENYQLYRFVSNKLPPTTDSPADVSKHVWTNIDLCNIVERLGRKLSNLRC